MNGKVHVAIGTSAVVCLLLKYPTGFEFEGMYMMPELMLLTVAAGSYAPDVDGARTHAGMKHKVTSKVVRTVGGGHRGITHTLLVPALLCALSYFINIYFSMYPIMRMLLLSIINGFNLGWVLHIFADLFNGKGCPIFWPIMKGKVPLADLPSEGKVPWMFAFVCFTLMLLITFGGLI